MKQLGHLETSIMEILWRDGELNVRDVVARLDRPLAYTTVMTTLDRLFKKKFLERRKRDRAFAYCPRITREEWQNKMPATGSGLWLAARSGLSSLLMSSLVDAFGQHDAKLLDELERRIQNKRAELGGSERP